MTFAFEKERVTAISPDGIPMGHIHFQQIKPSLVNIRQVKVLPAFRGQGIDSAMMEALLSYLERSNQKAALTAPLAQQYLAQGAKPRQACEQSGFTDYTSFYRAFKARTGVTPVQYGREKKQG